MSNQPSQTYIPSRTLKSEFPLIDNDPYDEPLMILEPNKTDIVFGAVAAAGGPGLLWTMEKLAPSHVGRGGFARAMRLAGFVGLCGGFLAAYNRSIMRFYGFSENAREVEMDMREMVGKVKRGEPLYGESTLTPHMQGVASRQSRFSAFFSDVVPWFNFVNHPQHGVDTAKYYRQAEKELDAERVSKGQDEIAQLG